MQDDDCLVGPKSRALARQAPLPDNGLSAHVARSHPVSPLLHYDKGLRRRNSPAVYGSVYRKISPLTGNTTHRRFERTSRGNILK